MTLSLLLALAVGCGPSTQGAHAPGLAGEAAPAHADPLGAYLDEAIPPPDGFEFPVGDPDGGGEYTDVASGKRYRGWYVATRFNEQYELGLHCTTTASRARSTRYPSER